MGLARHSHRGELSKGEHQPLLSGGRHPFQQAGHPHEGVLLGVHSRNGHDVGQLQGTEEGGGEGAGNTSSAGQVLY